MTPEPLLGADNGDPKPLDEHAALPLVESDTRQPTRHDFLHALHTDGYRDVRGLREGHQPMAFRIGVSSVTSVDEFADTFFDRNIYVGVAARAHANGGRLKDCLALTALFVDVDFKTLPEAEARSRVAAFPFPPNIVVATGGGLHVYWLLAQPLDLQPAKGVLRALATALGGDLTSAEPAHILRMPGTLNFKYTPPRPVVLERCDTTRRYTLDEVVAVLGPIPDSKPDVQEAPFAHTLAVETRTDLARRWLSKQEPAIQGHGGDQHTYSICCGVVIGHDLGEEQALQALQNWNARCVPPWPEQELRHKIGNAIRYGTGRRGARLRTTLPAIELVCLQDVEAEEVTWLWEPYIPSGKVTLIEGDPGVGKSYLSLALGTSISLGRGLPGQPERRPATVLLLSAEDGLGDTIRPRLDAMGAAAERIFAITGAVSLDEPGLAAIEEILADVQPAIVIIDPFVAYIGSRVDLHKANETRTVLAALGVIAARHQCAIVLIRHLTKGSRDKSIYRGIGSIDITAACRSVLLVGADADDPNKRALVQVKNNLAPFGPARGYVVTNGRFEWTSGVSDLTAQRILAPESDTGPKADAMAFLRDLLATGPVMSTNVVKEAKKFGISERTLYRAKTDLKVMSIAIREKGRVVGWEYSLPPGDDLPLQTEDRN